MNSNLIQHLLRSTRHHFSLQLMTVLVLSLVLLALSVVVGLQENLWRVNALWGDNLELTLYLKEAAPVDTVSNLLHDLQKEHGAAQVHLVGKDEALRRFIARMGNLAPDLIRSPEFENPLPSSIEIKLKEDDSPARLKVEKLKSLAAQFRSNKLVEDVSYGQGWIENWAGFLTSVNVLSLAAIALTILLGLLVIGNSVRVSISQRREEIEIMELVGATSLWIRMPFILEGAILGVIASMIAALAGFFLQTMLFTYLRSGLAFWSISQELKPLSPLGWILVGGIGAIFGAIGAFVCIRHLNSGWSAAERWNS